MKDETVICPSCKGEEMDQEWCWECSGTGKVSREREEKIRKAEEKKAMTISNILAVRVQLKRSKRPCVECGKTEPCEYCLILV